MKIWVDADACPVPVKEIVFRAAQRTGVHATLVANHSMSIPKSPHVELLIVPGGFDAADDEIVARVAAGDLVITSDIPLASQLIDAGALVLTPKGERHTADNIKARLNMRDFLETMRASGVQTGGPPPYSKADRKAFADQFDRLLAAGLRDAPR